MRTLILVCLLVVPFTAFSHDRLLEPQPAQRAEPGVSPSQACRPNTSPSCGLGGSVSLATLKDNVHRKSEKELRSAAKAFEARDYPRAIGCLRKMLERDPDFSGGHNDLGVNYLLSNNLALALNEFTRATALDPGSSYAHANRALALLASNLAKEAETEARRALQLNPVSAPSHYLLAVSLTRQDCFTPEVVKHLRAAEVDLPWVGNFIGAVDQVIAQRSHSTLALNEPE